MMASLRKGQKTGNSEMQDDIRQWKWLLMFK